MSFSFGKRSSRELDTCHPDIQKVMQMAISLTRIDFGVSEGHRAVSRQKLLYDQGLSKIDGVSKLGKHNLYPSEACDIYIYHPNDKLRRQLAYDKCSLAYVAGVIQTCATKLLETGEINHDVRWGGNWDQDGVILIDQRFDDMPHFELIPSTDK